MLPSRYSEAEETVPALESLAPALKASRDEARVLRRRLAWTGAIAASYALDTLFLGLFALAGVVAGGLVLSYAAAAALICVLTATAYRCSWNQVLRDPEMAEPQVVAALALQLAVVWAAPQIAFPWLCNIFTVFAFGMLSLSVRESLVIWALVVAGGGTVVYANAADLGMPVATPLQLVLLWSYFAAILGRFVMMSVYAGGMRARLSDSRRRLTATLDQVQRLISHDELTKTLNRRSLVERLGAEISRSERSAAAFSVALMDLDHFKVVNDTHGHAVGDEVLRGFAGSVHDAMRATDVFGRYGGEEFLLILTGSTVGAASEAAERIRSAVMAKEWAAIAPGLNVTVSVGLAAFRKGDSIEHILKRADTALYQAKHAGRNRIVTSES
ncbi:MAG: diguanylate cyclase [Betaproteobacteria bacterium]